MKKTKLDIQKTVTDSIIQQIEKGGILPWRCPWHINSTNQSLPFNFVSKRSYSGINILILWSETIEKGYSSNAWLTFKQAQELGGCVRKGEKSTRCTYFGQFNVDDESRADESKWIPFRKIYSVFNIEQVEDITIESVDELNTPVDQHTADSMLTTYCNNAGVEVRTGGNEAYYSPSLDIIKLPMNFVTGEDYMATLAHEIVHSTGHKKRLDRFDEHQLSFNRKNEAYAFEELIAELGAAFICAEIGIQGQHDQHVSYLASWLKHFKSDTSFLFKAAAAASKAHRFIATMADSSKDEFTKVA
jgi:antirestriction protein ArdC